MSEQDLLAAIDQEELAALTTTLVAIKSYPGEELAVQQFVYQWLTDEGIAAEYQETSEANRPNVLAVLDNGKGKHLLLNGHTDTVLAADGWQGDPWTARRVGDRLVGLGAGDMKSGVAAAMVATRTLARNRDRWRGRLTFSSVVDEEAYSVGARAMIAQGISADGCIVTESCWNPAIGSVGKILVRVDVTGKAAHASMPHLGINAAVEGAKFTSQLETLRFATHPQITASQSVLGFRSGNEQYVITVPETAQILINRHTVPGEEREAVLAQYRQLAEGLGSPATFEIGVEPPYYPAWHMAVDHPFIQQFAAVYRGETGQDPEWGYLGFGDANLFCVDAGLPTMMFGSLAGGFHEAEEWVDVPSIATVCRVIVRFATEFLAP